MDQQKLSASLRESCVYRSDLSSAGLLMEAQSHSWLNTCHMEVRGGHMPRRKCR